MTVAEMRAAELRAAIDWFDEQPDPASSLDEFVRLVERVAERLEGTPTVPIVGAHRHTTHATEMAARPPLTAAGRVGASQQAAAPVTPLAAAAAPGDLGARMMTAALEATDRILVRQAAS